MPKSVSIPLLFSLVFTFIVALLDYSKMAAFAAKAMNDSSSRAEILPNRDLLLSCFSQAFTLSTIVALFWIFYKAEKYSAAQFGKTVRDNISTIIVALAMSGLFGAIEILTILSKLLQTR
jgi:hypothetical protein